MSDYRQQEGLREQEWREDLEAKHPTLKAWPGKEQPMKQISAALVKAQRAFAPALKTNTNPHFKSKYADLSACVEAVIDALNANGIFLMQPPHECESGVMVETIFIHESGEQISAGKLHVPASKQDAQGYGSALTYARRYSLMAACGIAPEDDDGNAAARKQSFDVDASIRVINSASDTEALNLYWKAEVAKFDPRSEDYKKLKTAAAARKAELVGEPA